MAVQQLLLADVKLRLFCCLQALLSTAALEALQQVPAVTDLLTYILVRDLAQRPSAGDIYERCALPHQPSSLIAIRRAHFPAAANNISVGIKQ